MSGLLTQERFFVNQKAKFIELTNEYKIRDEEGNEIGHVTEEGQSKLKKVARFVTNLDQMMTHTYGLYDETGTKILETIRPRALIFSKVHVKDATGRDVGTLVQGKKLFKKFEFAIESPTGEKLGMVRAENWRAWNFQLLDATENEVGRITKKWAGSVKEIFTTSDNYMVEISPTVSGDLRLLMFAVATGIDTAIKQDDKN